MGNALPSLGPFPLVAWDPVWRLSDFNCNLCKYSGWFCLIHFYISTCSATFNWFWMNVHYKQYKGHVSLISYTKITVWLTVFPCLWLLCLFLLYPNLKCALSVLETNFKNWSSQNAICILLDKNIPKTDQTSKLNVFWSIITMARRNVDKASLLKYFHW